MSTYGVPNPARQVNPADKPEPPFEGPRRRSSVTTTIVPLTDIVVLGANPKRKCVVISNPSTGTIWYAWGQPAVVNQGFAVASGAPGFVQDIGWVGDIITQDLHAITTTTLHALTVLSAEY